MTLQFRIAGSDLQLVEIALPPGETFVSEPGAMMFSDEAVEMDTRLGDGVDEGFFSRLISGFKRAFTGENMFTTLYRNRTQRPLRVALAAPSPGKIVAIDLNTIGGTLICQRGAFLGATQGTRVGLAFKKRLRAGLFGGEGFVMQKVTGSGTVFIHASGTMMPVNLGPGEALRVDTGCLAALQPSVAYDVKYVGKLKTTIFGGEGLFLAYLKGPGMVWLQSLPIKRLRAALFMPLAQNRGVSAKMFYFFIVIIVVISALIGASREKQAEGAYDESGYSQQGY
jgi:uncharacterized protein (TIGR00266 family)